MQKTLPLFSVLVISIIFCSCSIVSPVFNQFETAKTLQKGNVELMGNYSGYHGASFSDETAVNKNLGFRFGYGVSDEVDLKFRYERLMPTQTNDDLLGANFYSFITKISLKEDALALLVPISLYDAKEKSTNGEDDVQYSFSSISPQLLYTYTNDKNTVDVTGSVKMEILFAGGGGGVLFGVNAGAGFSSNLSKWAIRPELGILSIGPGFFLSYGLGLQLILN